MALDGSQLRDPSIRLAGSYVNFLIVNGGIIAIILGDPLDGEAERILREVFPSTTWSWRYRAGEISWAVATSTASPSSNRRPSR